jgi:triosephosphate isomerase
MNLDRQSALELVTTLRDRIGDRSDVQVAVFPPFVYIDEIARLLSGSPIQVGGQNCCDEASGAFTGEVSAAQLKDVGATSVILGHSERRHLYGESNELVNAKVLHALATGLEVILCVGETIEEREAGKTENVVKDQLAAGLASVQAADLDRVTVAYEPVWAIGTGLTATPEQAQAVHSYLRGLISGLFEPEAAEALRIQYGGSVKPANVAELMACPDIDGALVGGASLAAASFAGIVAAAR